MEETPRFIAARRDSYTATAERLLGRAIAELGKGSPGAALQEATRAMNAITLAMEATKELQKCEMEQPEALEQGDVCKACMKLVIAPKHLCPVTLQDIPVTP